MTHAAPEDDSRRLAELIVSALTIADRLHANSVGISLNEALVRLTGEGVPPRG